MAMFHSGLNMKCITHLVIIALNAQVQQLSRILARWLGNSAFLTTGVRMLDKIFIESSQRCE